MASPGDNRRLPVGWLLLAACALLLLLGLLRPRPHGDAAVASGAAHPASPAAATAAPKSESRLPRPWLAAPGSQAGASAEEIVAHKVIQFGRSRRAIARGIARRSKKEMPSEVEKFFDAVESGRWEDIKAQWDELAKHSGQYEYSTNHWEEMDPFWPTVLDAYGAAEQAHLWPPQKLLDYGNTILGALRPGMVYVGGTDDGRWIPELLNDTSDGEQHIIVTQNAMADGRYLDFMNTLYGDRMTPLTSEDSQRAFAEYTADAQKRLEHDQQFPDEPKQVKPGEDLQVVDGKIQIRGATAVMAINEKLLQTLMQKNPDLSFAIQESFPLKGTYADAVPLGPLMELNAGGNQDSFTAERAVQSVDYWRNTAQQVLSEPPTDGADSPLKAYSHDAVAAANLLAAHNLPTEAEDVYRLATQFYPANPEAAVGLATLLANNGHQDEARQVLDDFDRKYPDQRKFLQRAVPPTITWSAKPQ